MGEIEYNLLDEPWIRVADENCTVSEVSLTDALLKAHTFKELSGELPTQDIAILRLLLAVLHTVFSRADAEGNPAPLDNEDEAIDRWESLWTLGHLPEKPIRDYLDTHRDDFWLFHPTRPFWQVPAAAGGTKYSAAKLNGELSESENKLRLFPLRAGNEKTMLTYAEAARWLLYVNSFDDTSAKPKAKGLPSPGAGWLGKLGLITASGKTLFETLMLNFVLLKDGETLWGEPKPCWERTEPKADERTEIALPDNAAQLLTLQSRRIALIRDNTAVTGYGLLGGDFFQKVNAFAEQMTTWSKVADKKNTPPAFQPKRHDPSRQMWRDFSQFFSQNTECRLPGVVQWIGRLEEFGLIDNYQMCHFRIDSVQYGDKDFFVTDVFSDSLRFDSGLLTTLGTSWQQNIADEIQKCEDMAKDVGRLAANLCKAAGGNPDAASASAAKAREQIYRRLDKPFRLWLESIDADSNISETAAKQLEWQGQARRLAHDLGNEMVEDAGDAAFVGRAITENKITYHYCSPKAFNIFSGQINKLYPSKEEA